MADLCWRLTNKHKEYFYSIYMSDATVVVRHRLHPLPSPSQHFVSPATSATDLHSWVERGTVSVMCLAPKHNAVTYSDLGQGSNNKTLSIS